MDKNNPIIIGDVEPFSIVDFPNKIAAVVFMQGCPWRCPFCYNISLQDIGANPESDWTFETLKIFLQKRKKVLDAVVFSGGEPLVQDGVEQAIDEVKSLGYQIGLHTGGFRPQMLERIVEKTDWVGLDIKAPLQPDKYKAATGCFSKVENVIESLNILISSGKKFECRTTCVPRILNVDDIYEIGKYLKNAGVKEYYLQKYRPVESDINTTDEMCETLVTNRDLLAFLQDSFEIFDVRK
ncbi:MAG: anaerobic ribonucleoside-triphosphate reductase activating protein [Alphaproteobacteria bacterium]|nr:anaerobic ribonucleoside-triphosphate reductase activating protein [Alphaproteobacteria bacterium]